MPLRTAHCLLLSICVALACSSLNCVFAEQDYDESLYSKCKWKKFETTTSAYIASGKKTDPYIFAQLATAQQKLKKYDDAEKTLRKGIRKHPDHPLCYTALAAWLALKSGDSRARKEAISLYETSVKTVKASDLNTYDYIPKLLKKLKHAPTNKPFPVISPTVKAAVNDLISCGFFSTWTAKDVFYDVVLSRGDTVEQPLDAYIAEGIAELDGSHFRNVATAFYTEIVLEMVSDLGEQNGYSARFISEKMLGDDGTREVAFEVNKQSIKAKIRTSRELLSLVNKALGKSATCQKRFHFLSAEDPEVQLIGFLNTQQVACLKSKGLFKGAVLL